MWEVGLFRIPAVSSKVGNAATLNAYGRLEVQRHPFLTSALDGGEWLALCPAALPLEKTPSLPI